MTALRVGVVLAAAVAAAVIANVVLLGVATGPNDPVGRLSPRALVSASVQSAPPAPAPVRTHRVEHERDD